MLETLLRKASSKSQCDKDRLIELLGAVVLESGLDGSTRSLAALYKMLVDDVLWFYDNCLNDDAAPETGDA